MFVSHRITCLFDCLGTDILAGIYEFFIRCTWIVHSSDKNRIDDLDELHSDFEERIRIIGRVEKILTVIYTERGERNRIISARQATKEEEEEYYEQFY